LKLHKYRSKIELHYTMDIKDVKNININIPNNLNELESELDLILNTSNKIINKYLEKQIFKSTISDSNKEKISIIFTKNKQLILEIL
jgi:hypothetical protein